ncbi:MAG: outer membrane protein assembly factor BamB family protein [Brachybacterium sp.]
MSDHSPWAPRPETVDVPEGSTADVPEGSSQAPDLPGPDTTTALGAAVAMLALAGICALLAEHFLLGALRLAAGLLAGAGLGTTLLALLGSRLRPRPRTVIALVTAAALALALTLPAVLATRIAPLAEQAMTTIDALGDGDTVHSLPEPEAPVLVRREGGGAELLDELGARHLEAAPEDVIALAADGTRAVHARATTTEVLTLDRTASGGADGGLPSLTLDGTPLALDGDLIVLRHCEDGTCRLSGHDLTAPADPLWTLLDAEETRGTDPAGAEVPARLGQAPGLLDAVRTTGVLPSVPLRFDPAQGWVQLDIATGFPVGRILAAPEEECRITTTAPTATALDPLHATPLVLTACSAEDGALTATAFREGEVLWESAPSPPGEWSVRLDGDTVLATGTEAGTDVPGEIVASGQRGDWAAPGGEGVRQASAFTSRIGIDGAAMVVTNDSGQLVAYDTADGTNLWTLPLTSPDAAVRGALGSGAAVVLDTVVREEPLEPRGAQRLRVIDAMTGEVAVEMLISEEVGAVHAVGGGRALVTVGGETLLLGR